MAAESSDHGRRNGEDGMSEYKSILVDRVKRLQRSSHEIKQQWYNYCRRNGTSHYDPSRHDESYLQAFLKSFEGPLAPPSSESHEPSPAKEMGGKAALIQRVKGIQRSSPDNKKAWYAFCARQCTTNYDPARHDEIFLRKFVEGFEEAAAASLAADQAAAAAAAAEAFGNWAGQASDSWWGGGCGGGCGGCKGGCEGCGGGGSSSSSSSGSWGGGWDPSSWSGGGGGGGGSGDDQWWDESGDWDNWLPPPAAWMMMMKGKSMMMAKGAAMWGGKGMASCGDMADKGKGAMAAMMQQMAAGCGKSGSSGGVPFIGAPAARLPPNTAPTGSSGGISEFGILDVPLTQERLNQKRGFGSCSVESTGAIMDEEQARKFQESLKKRKT